MKKKLPVVKKGIKSFILDEDAKVIDSTFSKIAITTGFLAANFLINLEDSNAGFFRKHVDNYIHNNSLNAPCDSGTGIHGGNNPTDIVVNNVSNETVETMHANHYNHQNGKTLRGGANFLRFVGIVMSGGLLAIPDAIAVNNDWYGKVEGGSIDTGTPKVMPEGLLKVLEYEEE